MTEHPTEMPYVRNPELCELCGQRQWPESFPLQQVTLEGPGGGGRSGKPFRAARVLYVCSRHDDAGAPRPPRAETLDGTSRKHPQVETLSEIPPDNAVREGRDA